MTINDIMPRIVRLHHDPIINSFFNIGFSDVISRLRDLFITDKNGLLVPITVVVKILYVD
jgi:hypothetical protein